MKITGIIAEYNPFHNGHALHIELARQQTKCSCIVVAMSGNFVQRGEAAMFDKWSRAEMAVRGGADLVLELPFAFAARSAQYFAAGGIRLLSALGASYLCFGAEEANLGLLNQAAHALDTTAMGEEFRHHMRQGVTYAKALSRSIIAHTGLPESCVTSPNNILAIEYLRALSRLAPHIIPIAIARQQSAYHDPVIRGNISSATAIRHSLRIAEAVNEEVEQAVPHTSSAIMKHLLLGQKGPINPLILETLLLAKLRTTPLASLENVPDVTEGMHHKIATCALQATSGEHFFSLVKSKRYTRTRLQRIAIHTLMGVNKNDIAGFDDTGPLYGRVLAFNDTGRDVLRQLTGQNSLPIIMKTTTVLNSRQRHGTNLSPIQKMLALDTKASDIFTLAMPHSRWRSGGWDFRQSPIYIR